MCGRFTITKPEAIRNEFSLRGEVDYPPRYNIVPSQTIPIIKQDERGYYRPAMVRWGLIPFWAKDEKIAYKMINARVYQEGWVRFMEAPAKLRRLSI